MRSSLCWGRVRMLPHRNTANCMVRHARQHVHRVASTWRRCGLAGSLGAPLPQPSNGTAWPPSDPASRTRPTRPDACRCKLSPQCALLVSASRKRAMRGQQLASDRRTGAQANSDLSGCGRHSQPSDGMTPPTLEFLSANVFNSRAHLAIKCHAMSVCRRSESITLHEFVQRPPIQRYRSIRIMQHNSRYKIK
jgi:hypothetical protein